MSRAANKKPDWLRVSLPGGAEHRALRSTLKRLDLHTVCEEARCPNVGECWSQGTATVMLLGDTCTRGCRFCAVRSGAPGGVVDPREPDHTAQALAHLGLRYVVLTMVDRDDLPDGGAAHVARTVRRIKHHRPELMVETLVGDFGGKRSAVATLVRDGRPDVFAHNVEVVPELQRQMRDARCSWERSVGVLRWAREAGARVTKSSLMVGCGERREQVLAAMRLLRQAGVDILTVGQYLRPSARHAEVDRYVEPAEFDDYAEVGRRMGFRFVASGPLVRSSYRAAEAFLAGTVRAGEAAFDRYGRPRSAVPMPQEAP